MDDESNDSQSQDGQESNEAAQNLTSSANAVQYQQATGMLTVKEYSFISDKLPIL